MTWEAVLASLHLLAVLTLVVFLSSKAALCRVEWMNAAVVRRLARLDVVCAWVALALLLSGIARLAWGVKGWEWYVSQPLFHLKVLLVVLVALLGWRPALAVRQWRKALDADGSLPPAASVRGVRQWTMVQAHGIPVIAVLAVFWAQGM